MNIAIITARGGSKRIPHKNIRPFLGRPIIAYSIETARASGIFDEVMVSTDSPEIADISSEYGAAVPFMRSAAASHDSATTADALKEVLGSYIEIGRPFEYACCIYPTAPFITTERLQTAYRMLLDSNADCVATVAPFGVPIWRALRSDNGRLSFIWPENALQRSQDFPPAFHDAGQFYFLRVNRFLENPQLIGENTIGLELDQLEVQDIDTQSDWRLAELKYQLLRGRMAGAFPPVDRRKD